MQPDSNETRGQQERENDPPLHGDTDPASASVDASADAVPPAGGYAGRDPKTEMPRLPSVPETQDDPGTHAAPDRKERDSHS